MSVHFIAATAKSQKVFVNLTKPPVSRSIAHNPHLLSLLQEIVPQCSLEGESPVITCDMHRPIGYTDMTVSKEQDAVFYAQLVKSDVYTKFVKNRNTEATSLLSLRLQLQDDASYLITDMQLGTFAPPLPSGEATTSRSQQYWEKHAVVYTGQPLIASSVTKDCPY